MIPSPEQRYERARRDAVNLMESWLFGDRASARAEDVLDAIELVALWRVHLSLEADASGAICGFSQSALDLMNEATRP